MSENIESNLDQAHIAIEGEISNLGATTIYRDVDSSKSNLELKFITDIEDGERVQIPKLVIKTEASKVDMVLGMDGIRNFSQFLAESVEFCENEVNTLKD